MQRLTNNKMYQLLSLCIAAFLLHGSASASNCTTFIGLVNNLYNTDNNLYYLNRIFFPQRASTPSLVHVTYVFKDPDPEPPLSVEENPADNVTSNCSVHYVWVKGGFLFIQPPSLFQLTSLLFYHDRGVKEYKLNLTLPWQCRELVEDSLSGGCSCGRGDYGSELLDTATRQLKVMAQYNDPVTMVRDASVQPCWSICEENVESMYHILDSDNPRAIGVIIFFVIMLLIPLMCISTTATIVRSLHKVMHKNIVKPLNHKNVAGMALMGMFVTFFIVGCDIVAVMVYIERSVHQRNRLGFTSVCSKVGFFSPVVLLAVDIIAFFHVLLVLLYICCKSTYIDNKYYKHLKEHCITRCFPRCFYPYFSVIFSTLSKKSDKKLHNKIQSDMELDGNGATVWIVTLAMAAPVLTISTHVGFVLVSWLTDMEKASSVALYYFAAILYLFLMLRQTYSAHAEVKLTGPLTFLLIFFPLWQSGYFLYSNVKALCCCKKSNKMSVLETPETPNESTSLLGQSNAQSINQTDSFSLSVSYPPQVTIALSEKSSSPSKDTDKFNTQAFCIAFAWGWGSILPIVLIYVAFAKLPIKTIDLFSNLLNTFQTFLLLVSLLVTYKIVSLSDSDISHFLKKLRKVYREFTENKQKTVNKEINDLEHTNDIEAAACIVGEVAQVVVHKLPQNSLS